jgi:hypothetical protein
VLTWVVSFAVFKLRRIEERWESHLAAAAAEETVRA